MMNKNSKNWKKRKCVTCDTIFLATDYQVNKRNKRFCSQKCKRLTIDDKIKISKSLEGRKAWNKGLKTGIISPNRNGKTFNCLTCEKEFYRSLWQIKKGNIKFCSLNCRRFTDEVKLKMSVARKGVSAWNKGLTKEIDVRVDYERPTKFKSQGKCSFKELIRKTYQYKKWVNDVFIRDNYICQECDKRGGNLEVHHIKPISLIIEENKITNLEDAFKCKELFNLENGQTLCKKCHKKTDTYLTRWAGRIYLKNYKIVGSLNFS